MKEGLSGPFHLYELRDIVGGGTAFRLLGPAVIAVSRKNSSSFSKIISG